MTPYGHRLKLALDLERQRMLNEWFFKWHFIGRDGPVEIDGFDGRKIRYGGIKFSGTARQVYWHTLGRYIRKKIDEVFGDVEDVVSSYPHVAAQDAIRYVENALTAFIARIGQDAIEKDRILRGNGVEFPALDHGQLGRLSLVNDVRARAETLRKHIEIVRSATINNPAGAQRRQPIMILRPSFWGIGIDLNAAWNRLGKYWNGGTVGPEQP